MVESVSESAIATYSLGDVQVPGTDCDCEQMARVCCGTNQPCHFYFFHFSFFIIFIFSFLFPRNIHMKEVS